jgi:hypothetical protein
VALFRGAYPRDDELQRSAEGDAARIRAETALASVIRTDGHRRRASTAANLLGILTVVDAASAPARGAAIDRSVVEFQNAIRLDPSNVEAKANLELLYQQNTSTSAGRGRERLQRSAHAAGDGIDAPELPRRRQGQAFDEGHAGGAERAVQEALGSGPTVSLGTSSGGHDLAPSLVGAAAVPVGHVLRRRNL